MVKVLLLCIACGSGFGTQVPEDLVGSKIDRLCYSRACLGMKPHLAVESPNYDLDEVDKALLTDIPDPRWLEATYMNHRLDRKARAWLKGHTKKIDPSLRKPFVSPQGFNVVFDRRLGNHDQFRGWVFTSLEFGFIV